MSNRIAQALKDVGATLVRAKRHRIYRLPNGRMIVVSQTPSDHRAEQNILQEIRRASR